MLNLIRSVCAIFTILILSVSAFGQAQGTPEDAAAIKAIVQAQADSWNRGDAPGFAARYAENGTFTNVIGQQIYGKPGFVAQHERIFSTIYKGSHNEFAVDKVIFLRPDVAIANIDGVLKGATRVPPGLSAAEVNGRNACEAAGGHDQGEGRLVDCCISQRSRDAIAAAATEVKTS